MAPSKSAKRLKLDQAFTKVDRENFYRCKLCSKDLEGLKDINFVTGATRHIDSKHSSFWKDDSTQSVISFNGNVTDRREHQRLNAAFQFAKTSLPINIFGMSLVENFYQRCNNYLLYRIIVQCKMI